MELFDYQILGITLANWWALATALMVPVSIVVGWTKTEKDDKVFGLIDNFLRFIALPNRSKKENYHTRNIWAIIGRFLNRK